MKCVLVTGASGFIGKPCIKALQKKNFEVHAISSKAQPKDASSLFWHQIDLHDHISVKKLLANICPSYLLHLAWYVAHGTYWTSDENLKWVNSSLNLVQEFINNGGQRIVGTGTCAEYDWSKESCSKSLSEELSLVNPNTLYGASKAGLYMILNALCQSKGVSLAWGRLFFPYGPGEQAQRLIPNTVKTLLEGNRTICKYPDLKRDFIFIEDIADIMTSLLDSHIVGPINIASGQAIELRYVVETIAKLLDAQKLVEYGSGAKSESEPPLILADVTRLKNELIYTKNTTIEDGLKQTILWLKDKISDSETMAVN